MVRANDRARLTLATGIRWERLTPAADADADFLLVRYGVGGATCGPDALMRLSGRGYGLVVEGRLGATVGFESYELSAGDSLVLESMTPHRLWTIGDAPCEVVWTIVAVANDAGSKFNP
jgi:hypothetical protein